MEYFAVITLFIAIAFIVSMGKRNKSEKETTVAAVFVLLLFLSSVFLSTGVLMESF